MHEDLTSPYQELEHGASLQIGAIKLQGELLEHAPVNLVLRSLTRHGLIAGATGSGKTKTMQVLCEQLALAGVPSLVMDIKGDISGLAMPGEEGKAIEDRGASMGISWTPKGFPVELLTISDVAGIPLRATVADFGALLFSRMLGLNETQTGVVTILFEYAKEKVLPLNDLDDFKVLLQWSQSEEGKAVLMASYGSVAASSVGAVMRKMIEIESQGGRDFFGEPAFQVADLTRCTSQGQGIISILRLMDMQDKPQLFSTFMLKLLTDIYRQFPELGDTDKPKLILFIDEAHLIFKNASKALLTALDTMVKLIRSKGVGLIFCTQTPNDIPESILGQLGLKIQHALRAFTAKDRQAMKLVAKNFPPSTDYDTEQLLTTLGIGEALLCALDAKGQPTPLVQCMLRPPESRMGVLSDEEARQAVVQSLLYGRYFHRENRVSAAERLNLGKHDNVASEQTGQVAKKREQKEAASMLEKMSKNTLVRQVVRDFFRWVLNSVLPRGRR